MRDFTARLIAPYLAKKGYRFGKKHRHLETITYKLVNTIRANWIADSLSTNHEGLKEI